MLQVIILLILSICLTLLIIFLLICYSAYHRLKRENRQLSYMLEDRFTLQSDSLEAYCSMIHEACREGGFWEDMDVSEKDNN